MNFIKIFKIKCLYINYFLIFFLFFFILPYTVKAEIKRETLGVDFVGDFVLEPAKNEVIIDPGQSSIEYLSIINRKKEPVDFQIEVEDIVGSNNIEEQVKLLGKEKGPYSLKDFLKPEISEFTLDPGEKITIPVQVSLPLDSEPRGYYGALIVSAKIKDSSFNENSQVQGTTKIITRLGSIFLVRVNGELIESGDLHDFKVVGPRKNIYFNQPQGFEVAMKNNGNVHLVHYGEVKIKNIFGKEVVALPINAFFSLPDSTRYREIFWPKMFVFGFYNAEVNVYRGYDEKDGYIIKNIPLLILPWKILTIVIVLTFIIYLIIRFFRSNFKIQRK